MFCMIAARGAPSNPFGLEILQAWMRYNDGGQMLLDLGLHDKFYKHAPEWRINVRISKEELPLSDARVEAWADIELEHMQMQLQ